MKRISLATTLVAAAFIGVMAIASASASATVLCKTAPANHYCGAENVYFKGTELHAELAPGTAAVLRGTNEEESTFTPGECKESTIDTTITNSGGLGLVWFGEPSMTFGSCGYKPIIAETGPEGFVEWKEGTHNGRLGTWLYLEIPKGYGYGKCQFLVFEGELVGGSSPKLVYDKSPAEYWAGSDPWCKEYEMEFSATYNISPAPLYVEKY